MSSEFERDIHLLIKRLLRRIELYHTYISANLYLHPNKSNNDILDLKQARDIYESELLKAINELNGFIDQKKFPKTHLKTEDAFAYMCIQGHVIASVKTVPMFWLQCIDNRKLHEIKTYYEMKRDDLSELQKQGFKHFMAYYENGKKTKPMPIPPHDLWQPIKPIDVPIDHNLFFGSAQEFYKTIREALQTQHLEFGNAIYSLHFDKKDTGRSSFFSEQQIKHLCQNAVLMHNFHFTYNVVMQAIRDNRLQTSDLHDIPFDELLELTMLLRKLGNQKKSFNFQMHQTNGQKALKKNIDYGQKLSNLEKIIVETHNNLPIRAIFQKQVQLPHYVEVFNPTNQLMASDLELYEKTKETIVRAVSNLAQPFDEILRFFTESTEQTRAAIKENTLDHKAIQEGFITEKQDLTFRKFLLYPNVIVPKDVIPLDDARSSDSTFFGKVTYLPEMSRTAYESFDKEKTIWYDYLRYKSLLKDSKSQKASIPNTEAVIMDYAKRLHPKFTESLLGLSHLSLLNTLITKLYFSKTAIQENMRSGKQSPYADQTIPQIQKEIIETHIKIHLVEHAIFSFQNLSPLPRFINHLKYLTLTIPTTDQRFGFWHWMGMTVENLNRIHPHPVIMALQKHALTPFTESRILLSPEEKELLTDLNLKGKTNLEFPYAEQKSILDRLQKKQNHYQAYIQHGQRLADFHLNQITQSHQQQNLIQNRQFLNRVGTRHQLAYEYKATGTFDNRNMGRPSHYMGESYQKLTKSKTTLFSPRQSNLSMRSHPSLPLANGYATAIVTDQLTKFIAPRFTKAYPKASERFSEFAFSVGALGTEIYTTQNYIKNTSKLNLKQSLTYSLNRRKQALTTMKSLKPWMKPYLPLAVIVGLQANIHK